eukprot:gene17665-19426_t
MLANHCRANLLLEKEYFKLQRNPIWGIDAHPIDQENFLNWQAVIKGPKETIWESGLFTVYIFFNEDYNSSPPNIFFHTIPFHPNIDMKTGRPCIDFIDNLNDWKTSYDLVYIFLNLQLMLSNPVLENPVNIEAAQMLHLRPKQYCQMVLDTVQASRRFEAGLSPFVLTPVPEMSNDKKDVASSRQVKMRQPAMQKIAFEDYYKTWNSIATSRPEDMTRAPLKDSPAAGIGKDDFKMHQIHFGVVKNELEAELRRQLAEHNALMYGKFEKPASRDDEGKIGELKATKVQLLKQIYYKTQDLTRNYECDDDVNAAGNGLGESEDPLEHEVDNLVSWTEKLSDPE